MPASRQICVPKFGRVCDTAFIWVPGESHLREGDQREIGLIWRMAEDDRKRHRLFFTGSGLRNQCLIVFYPGRQTGMVVFTNDVLPDSYLEELSDSVLHDLEFQPLVASREDPFTSYSCSALGPSPVDLVASRMRAMSQDLLRIGPPLPPAKLWETSTSCPEMDRLGARDPSVRFQEAMRATTSARTPCRPRPSPERFGQWSRHGPRSPWGPRRTLL